MCEVSGSFWFGREASLNEQNNFQTPRLAKIKNTKLAWPAPRMASTTVARFLYNYWK